MDSEQEVTGVDPTSPRALQRVQRGIKVMSNIGAAFSGAGIFAVMILAVVDVVGLVLLGFAHPRC